MKVILLNDVKNIGRKFDSVQVADGYAMHFLIPRGMAKMASVAEERHFETLRAAEDARRVARMRALAEALGGKGKEAVRVEISAPANEKGGLYKGIHKADIADALKKTLGVELFPSEIGGDEEYKEVGEYALPVLSGTDSETAITLVVTPAPAAKASS